MKTSKFTAMLVPSSLRILQKKPYANLKIKTGSTRQVQHVSIIDAQQITKFLGTYNSATRS